MDKQESNDCDVSCEKGKHDAAVDNQANRCQLILEIKVIYVPVIHKQNNSDNHTENKQSEHGLHVWLLKVHSCGNRAWGPKASRWSRWTGRWRGCLCPEGPGVPPSVRSRLRRLGRRKVYLSGECNDLCATAEALFHLMKVNPIRMVPINPLTALYALVRARLNRSGSRVPSTLSHILKRV